MLCTFSFRFDNRLNGVLFTCVKCSLKIQKCVVVRRLFISFIGTCFSIHKMLYYNASLMGVWWLPNFPGYSFCSRIIQKLFAGTLGLTSLFTDTLSARSASWLFSLGVTSTTSVCVDQPCSILLMLFFPSCLCRLLSGILKYFFQRSIRSSELVCRSHLLMCVFPHSAPLYYFSLELFPCSYRTYAGYSLQVFPLLIFLMRRLSRIVFWIPPESERAPKSLRETNNSQYHFLKL